LTFFALASILFGFGILLVSVYLYYKMTTGQIIRISQDLTPAKIWESMGLYYSQNKMPRQKLTPSKIWASMGLCYSHNTNKYGKKNYPYKEVLPLALLLWKYHLPQVNTIVRMVHTEPKLTEEMKKYKAMLERAGAVVVFLHHAFVDIFDGKYES